MGTWEEAGKIVLEKLLEAGFQAYIVGGAVRDKLLNRQIHDIDICTNGGISDFKKIFPRIIETGAEHGTVIIPVKGRLVEVSEFKRNGDGSGDTLLVDLSMRDFTCNSIAQKLDGSLVDPFNGEQDIRNSTLKITGSSDRFIEDPLRLLRALRFSIQLEFKIESQTEEWMEEHAALIENCSVERIASELEKMSVDKPLYSKELVSILDNPVLKQLPNLFPERERYIKEFNVIEKKDEFFIQGLLEWWTFAAYSKDLIETRTVLRTYKRSNKIMRTILNIVSEVHKADTEPWNNLHLYRLGKNNIPAAEKLKAVLAGRKPNFIPLLRQYENLPVHSKKDLEITGDILKNKFPDKPVNWIGTALTVIEEAVVEKKLDNELHEIVEWLKRENV